MNNPIENNELNAELQELYLTGKQWLSDLDFFEEEINSVAKLSQTLPGTNGLSKNLINLSQSHLLLKNEITEFMNTLGVQIIAAEKHITLKLLEDHIELGQKAEALMRAFKAQRKLVLTQYLSGGHLAD